MISIWIDIQVIYHYQHGDSRQEYMRVSSVVMIRTDRSYNYVLTRYHRTTISHRETI